METCTPSEAAERIGTRDSLGLPLGPGQPPSFLHALGERDDFRDLQVFGALLIDLFPLFARSGVHLRSGFFGPVERALLAAGHDVAFVPGDFRRFAEIARRFSPRVVATAAAPPDAHGNLSLSLHAGATTDEIHRCGADPDRLLVVEVNEQMPRTLGLPPEHPHAVHVDEVDVLVRGDRPPPVLANDAPGEIERAIAEHALAYIREGATLQAGIGQIPNAIAALLAEGPGGDYGIHGEMFTTGLMDLHRSGKVSNKKGVFDGVSVATFAMGTRELYDWLDGQEAVRFLPVHLTNDPAVIRRNRHMVSINGALAIDLAGQIAADVIGGRQHSGIGGHEDFVAGAGRAPGGRSLVCMPSTATAGGERVSRILSELPQGAMVTTPRHQADVVITEFGAAELMGLTTAERARALLEITHPDFRDAVAAGER